MDCNFCYGVCMTNKIDITGQRFFRLVVIREAEKRGNRYLWLCQCDCGKTTLATEWGMRRGKPKSCGCLRKEKALERVTTHGFSSGGMRTKEYRTWLTMKARCHAPSRRNMKNYAMKGIAVCDRWRKSFEHFLKDMGACPTPKHTIGRLDHNKGYEPGNCAWQTQKEQAESKNRIVVFGGVPLKVSEWSKKISVPSRIIRWRLNNGWSIERTLTTQYRPPKGVQITFNGKTQNLMEWSKELQIPYQRIHSRLYSRGMTFEEAITLPPGRNPQGEDGRFLKTNYATRTPVGRRYDRTGSPVPPALSPTPAERLDQSHPATEPDPHC